MHENNRKINLIARCDECNKENCLIRDKSQRELKFPGEPVCDLVKKHEQQLKLKESEERIKENIKILTSIDMVFVYNKKILDLKEIDSNKLDIDIEVYRKNILIDNYDKINCYKDLIDLRMIDIRKYKEDDFIELSYAMLEIE